jgi:L-threonylcarbamoyladenylate synthase
LPRRRCASTGDNQEVKTLRLAVDSKKMEDAATRQAIARAAEILRQGGLVALPTETVYGLGANALDADAVGRIFAAKQRPSWDPIIVHIAGPVQNNEMLAGLVTEISPAARKLMQAFWPGPLTLLLPRSPAVPDAVTAGRTLVGIRMPADPVAFELIRQAGVPVAAPSANLFSHTSPTTAAHVLDDLDGRIDAILDAGPTTHGVESTVLDPTRKPMLIYRPGAITAEQIRAVAGDVEMHQSPLLHTVQATENLAALPSPGVGIRHYAPRAQLILVEAAPAELRRKLAEAVERHANKRVGIMLPSGWPAHARAAIFHWGRWEAPEELAAGLYAGLRALDAEACEVILCPVPPAKGIGAAIRDRLRKAAFEESPRGNS